MRKPGRKPGKTLSALERFWRDCDSSTDGCWLWKGAFTGAGYGQIYVNGKVVYTHRYAYTVIAGKAIPEGHDLDHLCRNRLCANPDHLEAVTRKENLRRGEHANGVWRRGLL